MSVRVGHVSSCAVCGLERTVTQAARGPVCGQAACRRVWVQKQKKAEKRAFDAACKDIVAKTGRCTDLTARVPYLDRDVIETPESDKNAFRKSLRTELREAFLSPQKGVAFPQSEEAKASNPLVDTSCIACRGKCCRLGRNHAFLDMENLQLLLAERPGDRPAAVYRDYVRRIPEKSMDQACIFQGKQGCVLPREKRSTVCNNFECDERLALRGALNGRNNASVLVVAMEGETVKTAVIAAAGGELDWVDV